MTADPTIPTRNGAVTGGIRTLMRVEGAALFFGPTLFYLISDAPWQLYALLFFAPDLALLGYLAGPRVGAIAYNALHSTIGPLLLAVAGVILLSPAAGPIALIWLAHIGFDRVLGFGLKYADGFKFTHLGRIGKDAAT
ncbi:MULTISPECIES: DUF4260 domain-containing protein [Rhodopseudomonas]|uniref:DUF4260 family protein n=1 Tax=Rhodopseudomonas palustris TaxID=1076 RepID=A0A0D7E2S0_RHOPL|nr:MULTISPECIES: DUF4260 domain-containing protein [Rhodopseudomonas]KIZ35148.1 hypothetical protein OO17_26050 [Rhodopseudomonas palustris]MDF3809411.1 DUF4260 domain-containing protein [Rhodopseudomonas sp. BAL398]WOK18570.1 DUF4260 domain-containing protein [Rhodopseudomonas sp. BAL398]